jgi:hypothetical protein
MKVTLSPSEYLVASTVGAMRRVASLRSGHAERHGLKSGAWDANIEGACGEMAAAKALGRYWDGAINSFKREDIPEMKELGLCGLQVRTMGRHNYDLLVRPGDSDTDKFILVTGACPEFVVRGWILGGDAKQEQWLAAHGGRSPAYFVPQSALRPISELFPGETRVL